MGFTTPPSFTVKINRFFQIHVKLKNRIFAVTPKRIISGLSLLNFFLVLTQGIIFRSLSGFPRNTLYTVYTSLFWPQRYAITALVSCHYNQRQRDKMTYYVLEVLLFVNRIIISVFTSDWAMRKQVVKLASSFLF